jgi:hypothetical protein
VSRPRIESMTMMRIRAGSVEETRRDTGMWAFVDVGFSREGKTAGLLLHDGQPRELTFAQLQAELVALATCSAQPLSLVLEAPLSAAFTSNGNPAGRAMEKGEAGHRYWYAGLGCQVTVAAAYLVRAMLESGVARDVRLFEGFVSFKDKGKRSSHSADVLAMRAVAWGLPGATGHVLSPERLAGPHASRMQSAFQVFGFDCQVPPVIVARVEWDDTLGSHAALRPHIDSRDG